MRRAVLFLAVVFTACVGPEPGDVESSNEPKTSAAPDVPGVAIVFRGTVVDERGRPVANGTLGPYLRIAAPVGLGQSGEDWVETDARGRFRFEQELAPHESGTHRCFFFESSDGRRVTDFVDLSRDLEPGEHQVGALVLAPLGDAQLVRGLSDDELLDRYRRMLRYRAVRRQEACLVEMARRGGPRWCRFLRVTYREEYDSWRESVTILTALRRAERLPDPLAVRIRSLPASRVLRCKLGELPELRVDRWNQDARKWSIKYCVGRRDIGNRHGRYAIVAVQPDDRISVASESKSGFQAMWQPKVLKPGESSGETVLAIGDYVEIAAPGRYELRVLCHDAEYLANEVNTVGFVCARSEPFTLIVTK